MAWIESHTIIRRHHKLIKLAKDARLRPVYAMGHLHALWHEVLEQQEDGDLTKWSDEFIASACEYPGSAQEWVRLLQKHGWLTGRLIHDWLDYAGKYLETKYRTGNYGRLVSIWRKHGKAYRKRGRGAGSSSMNEVRLKSDKSLPKVSQKSAHPPTYLPDLTEPNLTKPTAAPASERPVDSRSESPKATAGLPARTVEEQRLLTLRWRVPGEYRDLHISSLPIDYCRWALQNLRKLGTEYRLALELRVRQHEEDTKR